MEKYTVYFSLEDNKKNESIFFKSHPRVQFTLTYGHVAINTGSQYKLSINRRFADIFNEKAKQRNFCAVITEIPKDESSVRISPITRIRDIKLSSYKSTDDKGDKIIRISIKAKSKEDALDKQLEILDYMQENHINVISCYFDEAHF